MAIAGLIGCSLKFRALPGGFDEKTLSLFDDDIFSTSIGKQIGKLQSLSEREPHISKITAGRSAVATR